MAVLRVRGASGGAGRKSKCSEQMSPPEQRARVGFSSEIGTVLFFFFQTWFGTDRLREAWSALITGCVKAVSGTFRG